MDIPQDWIAALLGGGLIGIAASIHLLVCGNITGLSGIAYGAFNPKTPDFSWKISLIAGLLCGGAVSLLIIDAPFRNVSGRSNLLIIVAGLLVGYGTRLGMGCTSGHGVCGMSRLSKRSTVATITFMLSGAITVLLLRWIGGD